MKIQPPAPPRLTKEENRMLDRQVAAVLARQNPPVMSVWEWVVLGCFTGGIMFLLVYLLATVGVRPTDIMCGHPVHGMHFCGEQSPAEPLPEAP